MHTNTIQKNGITKESYYKGSCILISLHNFIKPMLKSSILKAYNCWQTRRSRKDLSTKPN